MKLKRIILLPIIFIALNTTGQILTAGDIMRFMNQNYEQINDNLIGRKYEFKENKEETIEEIFYTYWKWEYSPKKFERSKWFILALRTYESADLIGKFQKNIDYTIFTNNGYILLKNQFLQFGFKKSGIENSKDDNGNTIIKSKFKKGVYSLTINTFVNGQYEFSLSKWCDK
jgi:hypothetical protein